MEKTHIFESDSILLIFVKSLIFWVHYSRDWDTLDWSCKKFNTYSHGISALRGTLAYIKNFHHLCTHNAKCKNSTPLEDLEIKGRNLGFGGFFLLCIPMRWRENKRNKENWPIVVSFLNVMTAKRKKLLACPLRLIVCIGYALWP